MCRIGILGGTFDPIHYGHLLIAEEARQVFDFDQIVFVPNGTPPHKMDSPVSRPEDRYAMTELAIASNPRFSCDRMELERGGASYTLDTVRSFRESYLKLKNLYFITGADAVAEIPNWHQWETLVQECEFIAVTRPGYSLSTPANEQQARVMERVTRLVVPGLEISSTEIRRRIRTGHSVRYQTPDAVIDYIEQHGLYHFKDASV